MSLARARDLIHTQLQLGGVRKRDVVCRSLGAVQREHDRDAVYGLIGDLDPEAAHGSKSGTVVPGVER